MPRKVTLKQCMGDIAISVERDALASPNCTLSEDAEHQSIGLSACRRKLLKRAAGQVPAANRRMLEAGYGRKPRITREPN